MKFTYKARTKEGTGQKGTIEATTRKIAIDILEKYGLFITSLKQERKKNFLTKNISLAKKQSAKDLVIFTRQLGTMLKAAIPPLEAFRAQVLQTNNADFREKVLKMTEAIETGSAMSQAFNLYPKTFNTFFVSIIKSGEATGNVADALNYLADHLERDYNFNQKIKSAMIYPLFVMGVFFASFFVVIFFIVPKLAEILESFSGDLPLMTRGMIAIANFVKAGGWILAPFLIAPLIIIPVYIRRSARGKRFYHKISLRLPVLGQFYKKMYLARFGENLSVLISSGLPITQALKITKDIITNTCYKEAIAQTEERVSRGEKISAVLAENPKLFSAFTIQMVLTGEETGQLDKTLMEMVKFYYADIERTADKLTTLLEPILILVLGIGIAMLAFSVFVPLFNIGMSSGM